MARSDGYNTKTRQLILDYLINKRLPALFQFMCQLFRKI